MKSSIGEIIAAKIVNKRRAQILRSATERLRQNDYLLSGDAIRADLLDAEYVTDSDIVNEIFPRKS